MAYDKPYITFILSPAKIDLWAWVTATPEEIRMIVFNSGSPQGLIVSIPTGGQTQPIQIEGATLQWIKAQKKTKKKHSFGYNKNNHTISYSLLNFKSMKSLKSWFNNYVCKSTK